MKLTKIYTLYDLKIIIKGVKQIKIDNWLIKFRNPIPKEKLKNCLVCELHMNLNPDKNILTIFKDLTKKKVPKGSTPDKRILKDEFHYKPKHIPSLKEMPKTFQKYIKDALNDSSEVLTKLLKIIKWRFDLKGTINFSLRGEFFTFNKICYTLPHQISAKIFEINYFDLTKIKMRELKIFYHKDLFPASFDLILNIEKLEEVDLRGSYIQACSALEIAIKEFLTFFNRKMEGFFFRIPSPPIGNILQEINTIKVKNIILDNKLFSKNLIHKINNIIEERNRIVHRGSNTKINTREDIDTIIDFMYLLCYYQNMDWAGNHISDKFKSIFLNSK